MSKAYWCLAFILFVVGVYCSTCTAIIAWRAMTAGRITEGVVHWACSIMFAHSIFMSGYMVRHLLAGDLKVFKRLDE